MLLNCLTMSFKTDLDEFIFKNIASDLMLSKTDVLLKYIMKKKARIKENILS